MPRILAIDYGTKRVGLAVTDELKMIATPLGTYHSKDVMAYLKTYCAANAVETFVVGQPHRMDGSLSDAERHIQAFINLLKKTFAAKAKFSNMYPNCMAYLIFDSPNFKVRVGDFRTKLEAQALLFKLAEDFPTLFLVEDKINKPPVEPCY